MYFCCRLVWDQRQEFKELSSWEIIIILSLVHRAMTHVVHCPAVKVGTDTDMYCPAESRIENKIQPDRSSARKSQGENAALSNCQGFCSHILSKWCLIFAGFIRLCILWKKMFEFRTSTGFSGRRTFKPRSYEPGWPTITRLLVRHVLSCLCVFRNMNFKTNTSYLQPNEKTANY